ncbi:MAG: hypothetical protein ABJC60_10225 [Actinomycetota bacterium]
MTDHTPRDPRTDVGVDTERLVVVPDERTVLVPDATRRQSTVRRTTAVGSDAAIWAIGLLVGVLAAAAIFVWAVAPSNDRVSEASSSATPVTDTVAPDSDVARGLALAAPEGTRTDTLNINGDQDLLVLATAADAVDRFAGAPVTADGVEVTKLLGDRAFEVSNHHGSTMVVYLPYGIPGDVFITLRQEVTFVGSLSPISGDLTAIAGASAAAAAAGEGAYVIAVPESVHVVPPSSADAA